MVAAENSGGGVVCGGELLVSDSGGGSMKGVCFSLCLFFCVFCSDLFFTCHFKNCFLLKKMFVYLQHKVNL